MPATEPAILAEGLHKRYPGTVALDELDLTVPYGTVFGLLGPNGAGKTTAVRILTTLLRFDGGRAVVAGYDVAKQPRQVRHRIGLTGQQAAVDDILTAKQNLMIFGRLFHIGKKAAARRADELLAQFSLSEVANKAPKKFSGGMRRRLDLAASMILAPQVLFLDEPTTGLDPSGRREVWQAIRDLTARGTTVLLTTHYLDEADQLCDRIAVVDQGRNLVEDTPDGLKRRIGNERLRVVVTDPSDLPAVAALLAKVGMDAGEPTVDSADLSVSVAVDGVGALTEVAVRLREQEVTVADLGLRRPTLDEAFLALTGQSIAERTEVAA
ncbi:ATP-binding cassette domain-containing protein [Natronosporangium hydrolyticum]|uniref:ATP-binding cassette domain-containing protein n=1 Tax=Natronosporangium hydrolyticum TaxID=2811111 RepID=UPI001EFA19AF|nr:ATP-binding cassette domain-containing protein [Natronosporangium hydrolyticum]